MRPLAGLVFLDIGPWFHSLLFLLGFAPELIPARVPGHGPLAPPGWECSGTKYCCNQTITDFFKMYQFKNLFAKRNFPVAKAVGFWDYQAFITAASLFENQDFCTTSGIDMQVMELRAFLGHVGAKTSCGFGVATGCPTPHLREDAARSRRLPKKRYGTMRWGETGAKKDWSQVGSRPRPRRAPARPSPSPRRPCPLASRAS
ncbi:Endochitinase [Hordeum vulgare]|nr:Endochitinase [Hordeum vulgare]